MSAGGKSLVLMPTFRCNAACEHCGTFSHPGVRTRLPFDRVLALIDEAAALGFNGVVFSGGEATLEEEVLRAGIRRAALHGLNVRLVTNAQWASDDRSTEGRLYEWMFAGLTEIFISTGDEHVRFVPLDSVIRAARAAAAMGLTASVSVENRERNGVDARAVAGLLGDARVSVGIQNWVELRGAGASCGTSGFGGCEDVLSVFTVQADGIISPCCGIGIRVVRELQVGRAGVDTLAEVVARAEAMPRLHAIRTKGPERLLAEMQPDGGRPQGFVHQCQACIALHRNEPPIITK